MLSCDNIRENRSVSYGKDEENLNQYLELGEAPWADPLRHV